jgi:DNA/RNA endonuclease YhcR with UshA esterase domain
LAGYRLADEIQTYLKCASTLPLLPANTNRAASSEGTVKIGAMQASKYYDQAMVVTGKVAQVTVRPSITFVNLDQTGRDAPFTAVIFPENIGQFGDLQKLQGQNVEISGTVTEYRNKPEIILESPSQIKVIGGQ